MRKAVFIIMLRALAKDKQKEQGLRFSAIGYLKLNL
jgi:hypothetical protein